MTDQTTLKTGTMRGTWARSGICKKEESVDKPLQVSLSPLRWCVWNQSIAASLSVEKLISEADNVFGLSSVGGGGPAESSVEWLSSCCHFAISLMRARKKVWTIETTLTGESHTHMRMRNLLVTAGSVGLWVTECTEGALSRRRADPTSTPLVCPRPCVHAEQMGGYHLWCRTTIADRRLFLTILAKVKKRRNRRFIEG